MSVIRARRSMSDLEFYHRALKIDTELTNLLLKDFGIRDKVRDIKYYCDIKKMSEDDKEILLHIAEKYNLDDKIIEAYPMWLIEHYRETILRDLDDLFYNITQGNTIYPRSKDEWEEKRKHQTKAIANCLNILHTLQRLSNILPINANKFSRYIDMIDEEIKLLRGWRKANNRMLKTVCEISVPDFADNRKVE